MALARDANNNVVQALQPIDGTLQRLTPAAGTASPAAVLQAPGRACVVAVRVRTVTGIAHFRVGAANVAAAVNDFPITSDDGWMLFSLTGKTGADKKVATHVSIFAEAANLSVDIVEME